MTHTTAIDVDALLAEILLTSEGKADPYPRYAAIREAGPAHRTALGFVVVGRYDDCQALLRDARFGKGEPGPIWDFYDLTEQQWQDRFGAFTKQTRSMLGLDPPDHTRLRRLVAKAFTPKTVENLRPEIERLSDELFDACGTEVDVISQLALPLPMNVISEMVGIPVEYRTELQPLVRASVVTLEINPSLDQLEAASLAISQVSEIVEQLITERRAHPTDDLLSELIHVEEQGDQLSHDELISTVMLIFGAGFETTTNLIGNGLLALLDHPDQFQRLRDDPSLMPNAVEELLRWDSPVQLDGRKALEPAEIHGLPLAAGEEFVTLLGGANRDPRVFPDPERLDVGRRGHQPMSFGAGIHFCLGAALARAEGRVFFERLLDRYAGVEPAWTERPRYRDSVVLRGLESLPVTLTPA